MRPNHTHDVFTQAKWPSTQLTFTKEKYCATAHGSSTIVSVNEGKLESSKGNEKIASRLV